MIFGRFSYLIKSIIFMIICIVIYSVFSNIVIDNFNRSNLSYSDLEYYSYTYSAYTRISSGQYSAYIEIYVLEEDKPLIINSDVLSVVDHNKLKEIDENNVIEVYVIDIVNTEKYDYEIVEIKDDNKFILNFNDWKDEIEVVADFSFTSLIISLLAFSILSIVNLIYFIQNRKEV